MQVPGLNPDETHLHGFHSLIPFHGLGDFSIGFVM